MKYIKNIGILPFFVIMLTSCYSQQLVKKTSDLSMIEQYKERFIGKPLSELLKEIKPPIKNVTAFATKNSISGIGFFRLRFVDQKTSDSLFQKESKIVRTLMIYIEEDFDFDLRKRGKGKENDWTKQDKEKYGSLIIKGLRVYGED